MVQGKQGHRPNSRSPGISVTFFTIFSFDNSLNKSSVCVAFSAVCPPHRFPMDCFRLVIVVSSSKNIAHSLISNTFQALTSLVLIHSSSVWQLAVNNCQKRLNTETTSVTKRNRSVLFFRCRMRESALLKRAFPGRLVVSLLFIAIPKTLSSPDLTYSPAFTVPWIFPLKPTGVKLTCLYRCAYLSSWATENEI